MTKLLVQGLALRRQNLRLFLGRSRRRFQGVDRILQVVVEERSSRSDVWVVEDVLQRAAVFQSRVPITKQFQLASLIIHSKKRKGAHTKRVPLVSTECYS